jgi:CheY-like chemotaxis protein
MGGRIDVQSTLGRGSTFSFELSFPVTADEIADCETASALVGHRLLIVDRDEARGRGLARVVRRLGARYETAPSVGEALARLRHAADGGDPFRALLLSHPNPGSTTARVLRTISEDPVAAGTPVLLAVEEDEAGARGLAAAGVLTRPIDQTALKAALLSLDVDSDSAAPPKSKAPAHPTARILLVEDNKVNQKLVLALLARDDYHADVAENGFEAVEAIQRGVYGLILMDCQMPGMDGYEATRRIRAMNGDAASVPIVALTANAMEGDRDRCLDAGMDDYLGKPLRGEDLRMVLERWSPKARH